MLTLPPDLLCFGYYKPLKDYERPELIGTYQFLVLDEGPQGGFAASPTFAADVLARDGRTLLNYEWGDVPSPHAGRALDLHRAASARVRHVASKLKEARVYYLDASGKVTEGEESTLALRLRELLALAPEVASAAFVADLRAALYPSATFAAHPVATVAAPAP